VITRFVDVGIAVRDLDAAIDKYSQILGRNPTILPPGYYAYSGLKGARFDLGNASISLVASEDEGSPLGRFIKRRGEGVNHITFEVSDLEHQVERMWKEGGRFITTRPLPFGDGKVIFVHPQYLHGVQVALMESGHHTPASHQS
jgi:methylmalonyl-CoA/ethylmalonyl-CoA epimerase